MTEEQQYCYQALAQLREAYERAAKPYLDRLTEIESTRTGPTLMLTPTQAREFINRNGQSPAGEGR